MEEKLLGEVKKEEEITYHAREVNGEITAIWQMKGRKHVRTIDPKSEEGRRILETYKPTEKQDEDTRS